MPSSLTRLPTSKLELISALRALAERNPRTREEKGQLEQDCVALALHIQRNMAVHDMPHVIWHFLHDPDIRFKDPAYAEMQLAEVRDTLSQWAAADDI